MRNAPNCKVEKYRVGGPPGSNCGVFQVGQLKVIAGDGLGWDHVSVSREDRIPNWSEMMDVKRMFFKDDECAMQLAPAEQNYVNLHPRVLHWWRPQTEEELEAVKAQWARDGEPYPWPDLKSPGAIPLPPLEAV